VPYAAVHFSAYEWYRQALVDRVVLRGGSGRSGSAAAPVSPVWDLLAGSAAGGTAVLATYPLDLVRARPLSACFPMCRTCSES
jgi:solute carrier family 25 protein 16